MIKIEHPDLDNIAKAYFVDIKERIKERSSFFLLILDVLYRGTNYGQLDNLD